MEEWIDIRERARGGVSISEIARQTGHDRKTIRTVLQQEVPKTQRVATSRRASKLDEHRDYLLQRSAEGCLNASVLLDELRERGYDGKLTILNDFLRPLRQEIRRAREATERFETAPGKQAQVDWGSFGRIREGTTERWRKLYAFVFTLGYSRAHYLAFTTRCDMEHFLGCHLDAFGALGIPEQVLYDNLKTGILGRNRENVPIVPGRFLDFALYYGFTPRYCQPYRARTKGKVERGVGYVRQNFWERVRREVERGHMELAALNERAQIWTAEVAHARVHGTHGEVVAVRLAEELPLLGRIDARPRYDPSYQTMRRVGRDGRLSYRGQLYQVSLRHALTEVVVQESLQGMVAIRTLDGVGVVATAVDRMGKAPSTAGEPTGEVRLTLVNVPAVEQRDLAIYEEVARAAHHG